MFFSDKSDLISLPFKSRKAHFSKAQIEWKGFVLNPLGSQDRSIVDLSSEDLAELLWDLYQDLTFIEFAELHQALQSHDQLSSAIDWPEFSKRQQFHWNERSMELCQKLLSTNPAFRQWCFDKKASSQDLAPLLSLQPMESFNSFASLFLEKNFSRSEGKKAIDLLVDLLMMKVSIPDLNVRDAQEWLKATHETRYPNLTQKDAQQKEAHNWPRYVHIQKQRQGDRVLEKMQITYSDKKDLAEKLSRLQQLELN